MPSTQAPKIKLSSGHEMPVLGLGTWQGSVNPEDLDEITNAVIDAIEAGYRHIDGAQIYGNETATGKAIKAKIDDGTVKREDLFIVSKLWDNSHAAGCVLPAIKKTLSNLGLEYLDLYLVHWPMGLQPGGDLIPYDADGNAIIDDETDLAETWKQMEELVKLGLVKSIGISNYNSEQIEYIMKNCTIPPAVIQVEMHPYFQQKKLNELCKRHGITVTAYSPFGCPSHADLKPEDPKLLEDPRIVEVGNKYGKKPNHVILRWLIQKNVITIPKSANKNRIIDNFNVFDFTLTEDDMAVMETLDRGKAGRVYLETFMEESKNYPFKLEF